MPWYKEPLLITAAAITAIAGFLLLITPTKRRCRKCGSWHTTPLRNGFWICTSCRHIFR